MARKIVDVFFAVGLLCIAGVVFGYYWYFKTPPDRLLLKDFKPESTLVVPETKVLQARFPVFDTHIHLEYSGLRAEEVVKIMDACNIYKIVDLETHGLYGQKLAAHIEKFAKKFPDRFITVANLDFSGIDQPDYPVRVVERLDEAYRMGARALKIWRDLGLRVRDSRGRLVRLDDPRFDGVWKRAAELRIPVIMHNADPSAFWRPVDRHNERYMELQAHLTERENPWGKYGPLFECLTGRFFKVSLMRHPDRLYYDSEFNWEGTYFPTKDQILAQRDNVMRRHPDTIFIGAHMGYSPDNLAFLSQELDAFPNYYVDISHVIPELGRQPFTSRDFILKYQDRIVFGLDGKPELEAYRATFRFLETFDEYFDYPRADWDLFGRWKIYGIGLPDEVLRKVYSRNAETLFHSALN